MDFLPIKREKDKIYDFVIVSGDAYVDHPSFGVFVIGRLAEAAGFSVGVISQPTKRADYMKFGEPRYAFLVSSGVVDSMVNNYTAAKKKRKKDVYSDGGMAGKRPDRALTVYCNYLKDLYPKTMIIAGGVEASLRRFAHYDYWSDSVMPSVIVDSKADLIVYGMGEKPFLEILSLIEKGVPIHDIKHVAGTMYATTKADMPNILQQKTATREAVFCLSLSEVRASKLNYVKAFNTQRHTDKILIQKHDNIYVVQNVQAQPLTTKELDAVFDLPFLRAFHPTYKNIPALEEVQFSISHVRGCFGGCSYCALNFHQGSTISKQSKKNILKQAKSFLSHPDFKGIISDIGGPTANFRNSPCKVNCCDKKGAVEAKNNSQQGKAVYKKSCIGYSPCKNLEVDHSEYLSILRELRQMHGIKKVFIRSGIRYDYLLMDKDDTFFEELIRYHVSGQLKVAPEHKSLRVLRLMNKPSFDVYLRFKEKFTKLCKKFDKEQYLVPYFISSHPGSTLADAIDLAVYLKSINSCPEQVQDFYPTPSTASTTMYYAEMDLDTFEPIYVPKVWQEKQMQRALLQSPKKQNYELVKCALIKAGRQDLIGNGKHCLIR